MTKKYTSECALGPKALEMVMRDVLGGMEELAALKGYESLSDVFEVISIDSPYGNEKGGLRTPVPKQMDRPRKADVIPLESFRNRKKRT